MKTICIITSSHGRNDIRLFQKHTKTLSDNGYNVIYVLNDGQEDEIKDNYIITTLGLPKAGKFERIFKLSSLLLPKLLELDADLYQVCDPEILDLGRKLKKVGRTVIFDSVEDWEGYYGSMLPGVFGYALKNYMSFSLSRNLKYYDKILVMSPNIQKRLEKYVPSKVEIVSNYPIVKDHPSSVVDMNSYLMNDKQFIYCGTTYNFSIQEEVASSLRELGIADSWHMIVGTIRDERKASIVNAGGEYAKFVPWVTKEDLLKLYCKSICGVIIFKYTPVCCGKEGQMGSNKIFEYMLEGLPIICTDFDLWKTLIIDKYKCGICVNPENKEEIKNAIKYIIEHRVEAYEMGQRGRYAVHSEFNWETQAAKYITIIEELTK